VALGEDLRDVLRHGSGKTSHVFSAQNANDRGTGDGRPSRNQEGLKNNVCEFPHIAGPRLLPEQFDRVEFETGVG